MNSSIAAIVVLFLAVSAFYLQKAGTKKRRKRKQTNDSETNS